MNHGSPPEDVSFDGLARRFKGNIYDTPKGQLRLAVLARDFAEHLPDRPLSVLDLGAGQGQCALELTRRGHRVFLSDISAEMLAIAQENFHAAKLEPEVLEATRWLHSPLQQVRDQLGESFDLVTCHAVMEWLAHPESLLDCMTGLIRRDGWLSLIFYNVNGLIFKNLLRTNYRKITDGNFRRHKGSLTPPNPLRPEVVLAWLHNAGYEVICQSGIRVFHDYILDPALRKKDLEQAVALELTYSRQMPYRDLGRYIHVLCRYRGS